MRYAFVVAARVWPWLARPLPPSLRRQTVCILTAALLLAVISPLFPAPASTVIAVATVAMIGVSFGVDIAWLARQQEIQHRT